MNTNADCFCDSADDGAAIGLLCLMTGISEDCWCAGWMSGLEHSLWKIAPNTSYGQGIITERQSTLLRLLHEESGGWWAWRKEPKFLRTSEWLEHLKSLPRKEIAE